MYRTCRLFVQIFLLWTWMLSLALASEQGLLWHISGQGADAYLFGTMHSEDSRVVQLPEVVEHHFGSADVLMLEVSLDAQTEQMLAQKMLLPPDQSLRSLVGETLAKQAEEAMLERGIPPALTGRLQPWATVLMLSLPPQQSGLFLDKRLYQRAMSEGKRFLPLESADEQIAVFTSLNTAEQKTLLRGVLAEYKGYPALFGQMTEAYLGRDLARLVQISSAHPMSRDQRLQRKVMVHLLDKRNRRMVERMRPVLHEGQPFIAVGALHLPGEQGVISLLRDQGYTLELLY